MTKLSHSAANRYVECGKSYQLHYLERLRPTEQSAALLFGTAIDKATEHYALSIKANTKTRELAAKEAFHTFQDTWLEQELNGTTTRLQFCTEIVYGNNDLDLELLDQSDYKLVAETYNTQDVNATIADILERKDQVGFRKLSHNDKEILNCVNWLCMRQKGKLMVDAFVKWFDANVVEVLATQKKIELVADDDSVVGFADLICRVKGYDKPVVLDVKTSARAYEDDSVLKSPQLALYVFSTKHEYDDTNFAGYIVLQKNVKKNRTKVCSVCSYDGSGGSHKSCPNEKEGFDAKGKPKMVRCGGEWNIAIHPEVIVQYLVDEVPELLQERVVENYEQIANGVKAKVFPRNFQSCIKYNGAVVCSFYNLCHKNTDEGLIKKEEDAK